MKKKAWNYNGSTPWYGNSFDDGCLQTCSVSPTCSESIKSQQGKTEERKKPVYCTLEQEGRDEGILESHCLDS